jgi:ANTAR domain
MRESSRRVAGEDGPGRLGQRPDGHDERRVRDRRALYAQALAAREQSVLLAGRLQATQRKTGENWQLIQDAWGRVEQIRARRLAARSGTDRLRYSAYARMQARLASMPVIEQAKGIIMARYGWPEDQAFDALRRASQRQNIKVRDLATIIVAGAARPAPARRHLPSVPAGADPDAVGNPPISRGGSQDRQRALA